MAAFYEWGISSLYYFAIHIEDILRIYPIADFFGGDINAQ
jgi:hypothetical protein